MLTEDVGRTVTIDTQVEDTSNGRVKFVYVSVDGPDDRFYTLRRDDSRTVRDIATDMTAYAAYLEDILDKVRKYEAVDAFAPWTAPEVTRAEDLTSDDMPTPAAAEDARKVCEARRRPRVVVHPVDPSMLRDHPAGTVTYTWHAPHVVDFPAEPAEGTTRVTVDPSLATHDPSEHNPGVRLTDWHTLSPFEAARAALLEDALSA